MPYSPIFRYYEYCCAKCGATKKIGFTCKSRLCLRCFKVAVDAWLNQARKTLFEGVVHRQVVLTVPKQRRPLIMSGEKFLKAYMDAGALAIKELVAEWREKLGAMFEKYPTGFDCDCMPEEGPVERLVIYLCKYVSSPPISIRRIEGYDGQNVTYRYKDHRRGEVKETLTAIDFIGRMIQHLPPKGFRMVRYYGIYARPVRAKIHALVATVLKNLVDCARKVAEYFALKNGRKTACPSSARDEYQKKAEERFGKGDVCCPECGEKMTLIRIWSKARRVVYDRVRDGSGEGKQSSVVKDNVIVKLDEQLAFTF